MRMTAASCLFLLLTVAPTFAAPPGIPGYGTADAPRDIDPLQLGRLFCEARIRGDMQPLERYFAPKLAELLAQHQATPVPWQGRAERPSACTEEIVNGIDDTIGVLVGITYTGPQARWSDVLNLERTPDSWRINNVFYEGGGNLRFRLFELLD